MKKQKKLVVVENAYIVKLKKQAALAYEKALAERRNNNPYHQSIRS